MQAPAPTPSSGPQLRVVPGQADARTGAIVIGKLPRAAALAAVTAVVADLAVYFIATALWSVPGEYAVIFNPVTIVATAVVGVVVAAVGLAVLARLIRRRAVPIFVGAAVVVTLLSLMGPLQTMAGAMPGLPPATTATVITMIVMHFLTGGIIAGLLPMQARR